MTRSLLSRFAVWSAPILAGGLFTSPPAQAQTPAPTPAAAAAPVPAPGADPIAVAARGLLDKKKASLVVVTVEGRLTTTTDGDPLPDQQQQRRTLGVSILSNGLIVISNSAVDPSVGLAGQKARLDEKVVTIQTAKTLFEKVEISYGDSTVLPGAVIGQDADADVAFVLPDQVEAQRKAKVFDFVDLGNSAQLEAGDEVVGLSRSSSAYAYMPTVIVGRVTGVYNGERRYFVTTAGTAQGIPVFAMDGRLVGITLERIIENKRTNILGTLASQSISVLAGLALDRHKAAGPAPATPPPAAPAAPATPAAPAGKKSAK